MIATCDCPAGNVPCGHPITQEDMLCDECRRGECRALGQSREEWQAVMADLRDQARKLLGGGTVVASEMVELRDQAQKLLATTKYGGTVDYRVWTAPTGGEIVIPPQ